MAQGDVIRAVPIHVLCSHGSQQTVVNCITKEVLLLPRSVSDVLRRCCVFRTPSLHVSHLLSQYKRSAISQEDLLGIIAFASAKHLFLQPSDFRLEGVPDQSSSEFRRRIEYIVIPTRNRWRQLERSLAAIKRVSEQAGRSFKVLVIDGSTDKIDLDRNASTIVSFAPFLPTLVRITKHDMAALARHLASALGLQVNVVHNLLCGDEDGTTSVGASRNVALLLTAGHHVLFLDDDICLDRANWTATRADGPCYAGESGQEYRFSQEADTRAGEAPFILTALESVLQHRKLDYKGDTDHSDTHAGILNACDHLCTDLLTQRAEVFVASLGVNGDSGMNSAAPILLQAMDRAGQPQAENEQDFRALLGTRRIHSAPDRVTYGHSHPFLAMTFALNNREGIPPFAPSGRNEDGVFAALMSSCFPSSYIADLPATTCHQPHRSAEYSLTPAEGLAQVRLNDLLQSHLSSLGKHHDAQPRLELAVVGATLRAAAASPGRWEEWARNTSLQLLSNRHAMVAAGAPNSRRLPSWLEAARLDVEQSLHKRLLSQVWLPEAESNCAPADASEMLRNRLRLAAEGLCAWSELRSVAESYLPMLASIGALSC